MKKIMYFCGSCDDIVKHKSKQVLSGILNQEQCENCGKNIRPSSRFFVYYEEVDVD